MQFFQYSYIIHELFVCFEKKLMHGNDAKHDSGLVERGIGFEKGVERRETFRSKADWIFIYFLSSFCICLCSLCEDVLCTCFSVYFP